MPIRTEVTGTTELMRDARYHVGALMARTATREFVAEVREKLKELRAKRNLAEDGEELGVELLGALVGVDTDLDELLKDLEMALFKLAKRNRKDPLYKAVLPKGIQVIAKLRGRTEALAVRDLLTRLKEHAPDLYTTYVDELKRLAKAEEEADSAWEQAESDAAHTFADEVVARARLVRVMQKNEGALLVLFPGKKARVRSFFRPSRRRGKAAAPVAAGEAKPN